MAENSSFTEADVRAALEAGLVSEQDAQELMASLQQEGVPWGAIAGGALGAAAGGYAGAKGGGKLGQILGNSAETARLGRAAFANSEVPPVGMMEGLSRGASRERPHPFRENATYNLAEEGMSGLGLSAGGVGGALGGGMMDGPPEMGEYDPAGNATEQVAKGLSDEDRTTALQALTDPNVPPQVKKEILAALQAYDAAEGGGEEEGGFPWGATAGGLAGAGLGALALGAGGRKLAGNMGALPVDGMRATQQMADPTAMQTAGDFMRSPAGKLGGGVLGAGGGAMLGDFAQAAMTPPPGQQRRYEDPLAG